MKQQKMVALKEFVFRGETLNVDEEFEPDTKEQGELLETIGLAGKKRRIYQTRRASPTVTSVMTASADHAGG